MAFGHASQHCTGQHLFAKHLLAGQSAKDIAFALEAPVAVVLLLGAATGAGFAMFDILWNTAMAERIPPRALSRSAPLRFAPELRSGSAANAVRPMCVARRRSK